MNGVSESINFQGYSAKQIRQDIDKVIRQDQKTHQPVLSEIKADFIDKLSNAKGKPFCIGTTGKSASGKSTVVDWIAKAFPNKSRTIVGADRFYIPLKEVHGDMTYPEAIKAGVDLEGPQNFDIKFLKQSLKDLKKGKPVSVDKIIFHENGMTRVPGEIKPAPLLLLEGIVSAVDEMRESIDGLALVEVSEDVRYQRMLKRNTGETKEFTNKVFSNTVKNSAYIDAARPKMDMIINGLASKEAIQKFVSSIAKAFK